MARVNLNLSTKDNERSKSLICYLDHKAILPIETGSYTAMVDCKFHEDTQETTGTGHRVPRPSQPCTWNGNIDFHE